MKRIAVALVIAGILVGTGLPTYAAVRDGRGDDALYWSREDVDSLFSSDLVRSLNLSRDQRNSLNDLRRRDWGRHTGDQYPRGLEALFDLGRLHGGSRVVIERGNNNLETFLALLSIGILISQNQESDRYYYNDVRIDDFLYLFFRILDMNQRQTFRIYFDRWYDDRYYHRKDHYRDSDRYRWELPRELENRLRLSEKQRREIERSFRDLYYRQKDLDKRYRDKEKDYLHKSWERTSDREIEKYRRDLFKIRRDSFTPQREASDRFRSVLDDHQRTIFDSMKRKDTHWQTQPKNPYVPKIVNPEKN